METTKNLPEVLTFGFKYKKSNGTLSPFIGASVRFFLNGTKTVLQLSAPIYPIEDTVTIKAIEIYAIFLRKRKPKRIDTKELPKPVVLSKGYQLNFELNRWES